MRRVRIKLFNFDHVRDSHGNIFAADGVQFTNPVPVITGSSSHIFHTSVDLVRIEDALYALLDTEDKWFKEVEAVFDKAFLIPIGKINESEILASRENPEVGRLIKSCNVTHIDFTLSKNSDERIGTIQSQMIDEAIEGIVLEDSID